MTANLRAYGRGACERQNHLWVPNPCSRFLPRASCPLLLLHESALAGGFVGGNSACFAFVSVRGTEESISPFRTFVHKLFSASAEKDSMDPASKYYKGAPFVCQAPICSGLRHWNACAPISCRSKLVRTSRHPDSFCENNSAAMYR